MYIIWRREKIAYFGVAQKWISYLGVTQKWISYFGVRQMKFLLRGDTIIEMQMKLLLGVTQLLRCKWNYYFGMMSQKKERPWESTGCCIVALKHECINFLLKIAFCHFFFKLLNYQKYINIKYQKNFWVTLNKFKKT